MQAGDRSLEMSFRDLVFSDFLRVHGGRPSWFAVLARIPGNPGLLATVLLRSNQCLQRAGHAFLARFLRTLGNAVLGIDQGGEMTIGPGLRVLDPVGVTLGSGVRIGDGVTLAGGVVLAARYYDPKEGQEQGFPTIEDGVVLGAHAVVVGPVTVGRNAVVRPNSVVLSAVPENTVVMGVPARRVAERGDPEPGGTPVGSDALA